MTTDDSLIVVAPVIPTVIVTTPGPQGASGDSNVFYTHVQAIASNTWTINHNLNGHPTAVVLDSAGTNCEGTFSYPSTDQLVITFTSAFTGTAYVI